MHEEITSKDNPAVRHYIGLRERKRIRRQEKLFVAEGLRIVRDALQRPELVDTVFLTATAVEKQPDFVRQLSPQTRLLYITDAVGRLMADTTHTQGVFAVCRLPEQMPVLCTDGRYLVLCGLQDPGNMGMILRTADALGVDAVLSAASCEICSPKVVRATMGSVFRVPFLETDDFAPVAAQLRAHQIRSYAAVLQDAVPLPACSLGEGCAVWIGNEGSGLPQDAADACDVRVTIPMQGGPESLNAAMAAGILMWEMTKQRGNVHA